jgi:predicted acyl esterase
MTFIAALLAVTSLASPALLARDVDIRTSDGTRLKATYFPAERPGPAVVLLQRAIGGVTVREVSLEWRQ